MSQFCGSLAALISRSLLTVILYCAAGWEAVSAVIDTPAHAAQAIVTNLRPGYCMLLPPLTLLRDALASRCSTETKLQILSAKRSPNNAAGDPIAPCDVRS